MANLAMTYMSQGRRTEAKGLQIEAVNQLRTTLGDDHPSTVTAIANLASFRKECTAPAPFCGNDNDKISSFKATLAMSVMDENDCEELVASKENISGRPILVVGKA